MAQHIQAEKRINKSAALHNTNLRRPSKRTPSGPLATLQTLADNSEAVQRVSELQNMANARYSPMQRRESSHPSNGLPQNLKLGIENLSGISMADVTVQRNSAEPAKVGAHAFAQGTTIHLGPGQDKHLPHEAWHVVQQKQGRVKPTMQMKGVAINDDVGLEREADVMGAKALQNSTAIDKGLHELPIDSKNPIQRYYVLDKANDIRWEETDPVPDHYRDLETIHNGDHGKDKIYRDPSKVEKKQVVEAEASSSASSSTSVPYQTVKKEDWKNDDAMRHHVWTYCDDDTKVTLVAAAIKLGFPPPMLGHGSGKSKGGTSKDAGLYAKFRTYMEEQLKGPEYGGGSLNDKAKRILKGKARK